MGKKFGDLKPPSEYLPQNVNNNLKLVFTSDQN